MRHFEEKCVLNNNTRPSIWFPYWLTIPSPCLTVKTQQSSFYTSSVTVTLYQIGQIRISGIGLELGCNGGLCGGISLKRVECNLHLKRLPRMSLTCKLVPVRNWEYTNMAYSPWNLKRTVRSLSWTF